MPGKSRGQRSLVSRNPWGREESDRTERLHFHFSLSCIGEGNGNPLQCSCLENPRDRGPWWAAVYGVAQSRTQLNLLSYSFGHYCKTRYLGQIITDTYVQKLIYMNLYYSSIYNSQKVECNLFPSTRNIEVPYHGIFIFCLIIQ